MVENQSGQQRVKTGDEERATVAGWLDYCKDEDVDECRKKRKGRGIGDWGGEGREQNKKKVKAIGHEDNCPE